MMCPASRPTPAPLPALLLALLLGVLPGLLLGGAGCSGRLPGEDALREATPAALEQTAQSLGQRVQADAEDDEARRLLALVELRLGRNESALEHALQAVALEPFVARHHLALGQAYEAVGRLLRAQASYGQAIELDPDLLPAYVHHANVQAKLGRRDQALATLREALRREPRHYGARWLEARLLHEQGQTRQALAAIEAARVLRPNDPAALVLHVEILRAAGHLEAALRLVEQGLRERPEDRRLLSALVRVLRERGLWDAARRALARLELAGPLTPAERMLRVDVLVGQGLQAQASTELDALLREAPNYAPAHVRRARELLLAGNAQEGLRMTEQSVALAPESAEAHYWSAVAHYQLGDDVLGDAALEVAERLGPESVSVKLLRIGRLLAQYRLDAAAPLLSPLLEDDAPERPAVLLLQSERATLQGELELAAQVLERLPPEFAPQQVRFARLRIAYLERRWADAESLSEGLLEHPLLGWRAAYLHASALLRQGKRPQALATVKPYLEGTRRRIVFYHLAGYLYLLEGNRTAAQRTFLAGLALSPGSPLMIEGLSRMAVDAADWPRAEALLRQGLESPDGYAQLFLERLIRVEQSRKNVQSSRETLDRYLDEADPVRAGTLPRPASAVLYGAYFPDYDLRPSL